MAAALGFVAKRVDATLCAQVRVGAGLKVVVVVAWCARCCITRWTRHVAARRAVVKLTGRALSLRTIAVVAARWTITKGCSGAFAFSGGAHIFAVAVDVSVGTGCAAAFSAFVVADALHHF